MIRTVMMMGGLALTACGGGAGRPPAQEPVVATEPVATRSEPAFSSRAYIDALFVQMVEYEQAMCACKTLACADGVSDQVDRWSKDEADKHPDPVPLSEADQKRALEIATHIGECRDAAEGRPAAE